MPRPVLLVIIVCLVACGSTAHGQVFYQYPTGEVLHDTDVAYGPYFAFGENELIRFSAFGRMAVSEYFDAGLEVLFDHVSDTFDEWRGGMGVDGKLQLFPAAARMPFDLSATAGFGFLAGQDTNFFQFPVGGIISSPYQLDNGKLFTPYLGVYVIFANAEVKATSSSDTDVDVELRLGASYSLGDSSELFAAVHFGNQWLLMIAANFWR